LSLQTTTTKKSIVIAEKNAPPFFLLKNASKADRAEWSAVLLPMQLGHSIFCNDTLLTTFPASPFASWQRSHP